MTFTWVKRLDGYYLEDKKSGGGRMANFRELQFIDEIDRLRAEIERLEREKEEVIKDKNMYQDLSSLLQSEIKTNYKSMIIANKILEQALPNKDGE